MNARMNSKPCVELIYMGVAALGSPDGRPCFVIETEHELVVIRDPDAFRAMVERIWQKFAMAEKSR